MDDTAARAPAVSLSAPASAALASALGISREAAETLVRAGHPSPEAVAKLSDVELREAGLSPAEIARVRLPRSTTPAADSEQIVEKWVGTIRRPEKSRKHRVTVAPKESTEVLRKWVGGDDRAMEDWIRSSEEVRPVAPAAPAPTPGPSAPAPSAPVTVGPLDAAVLEREETVVKWLTGLLDRVKSDQFDPATLIQESQDLHRQLFDERGRRKQLEDEIEHVKRGSIAVIKYVRSHEAKEKEAAVRAKEDEVAELKLRLLALQGAEGGRPAPAGAPAPPAPGVSPRAAADAAEKVAREVDARLREEFANREHEYIERETELRRRIVQLEGDVRNLRAETERGRDRAEMLAGAPANVAEEVRKRLEEVDSREKDLVARENALRTRFEEIRIQTDEMERRRSPLEFKERELGVYEERLSTRKQALDLEARRLEEMRREIAATGSASASDEARRVDDLRHQLTQKEEELRSRESALRERMVELEKLAGKAAEAEADQMHREAVADVQEAKVKSGVRRLDDLVYGGFPVGAQILVNGPAHTGKDTLARIFSAEGLKLGIPSIWVVTDKTWAQVKEDLTALFPGYPEAEKNGMVRYVDMYSRSVGSTQSGPGVRLLSSTDKAVLEQLASTVNGFSEELKARYPSYRLIFESVSTVTAYLDTAATFRFLQPFVGRRKIDGAAAYYVLETGMHSDADLETLEHMVDGSINLKVEQLKTFLAVRGVGEAQSRAWIGYTFTKRSLNLGSFSLDHIR
ncbi:MAG TPA: ATPase domain-containing protein [Thermoplasmata archaeon]|nr:ATPase domain-containing protein [Thermoplasmata archaeon]